LSEKDYIRKKNKWYDYAFGIHDLVLTISGYLRLKLGSMKTILETP